MHDPAAGLGALLRDSKTTPPMFNPAFVPRSALIAPLRSAASRLVTVTAPAGYRKTSLLTEWRQLEDRATGWVTLDAGDDDPAALIGLLAAACTEFAPGVEALLAHVDAGAGSPLGRLAPMLALTLSRATRPFVLFIDDIHVLERTDSIDALDVVLTGVPAESQVVLASRRRLAVLARRRLGASEVSVIAEDLRLDVPAAARIAAEAGVQADAPTLHAWVERCQGWAAGLHMCALLSRKGSVAAHGADPLVADYLYQECLRELPEEMRELLLRTSILQVHVPELCDAVAGRTDSARILRELEARQLFVTADPEHRAYRLHPLFHEYLREELERTAPAAVPALHGRAADWFQRMGELPLAIEHAIAAGELATAAALVAAEAIHAYEAGQVATLERWLAEIGDANLLRAPATVVVVTWVSLLAGSDAAAEKWGTLLDRVPESSEAAGGIDLASAQAMVRAIMMRGGLEAALADAEAAVTAEPAGSPWRDPALQILGSTLLHTGDEARAQRVLEEARHTADVHGNPATIVMCEAELAFLAIEADDWTTAHRHVDAALAAAGSGGIEGYVMCTYAHAAAACLELHAGHRVAGQRHLTIAMSGRHRCRRAVPLIGIPTRLLLVRAQLLVGDGVAARMLLAEISEILPAGGGGRSLDARIAAARGAVLQQGSSDRIGIGAVVLTLAEQRVLPYLQTHLSRAEIAERLFVSKNTVGTQISAIFRKLDVSNRTDAVRRATELGLLGL